MNLRFAGSLMVALLFYSVLPSERPRADELQTIKLIGHTFSKTSVPYNKPFQITGVLPLYAGPVDAVVLKIERKSKAGGSGKTPPGGYWIRSSEKDSEFKIAVGPLTPIHADFEFTFQFLIKVPTDPRSLVRISSAVENRLTELGKTNDFKFTLVTLLPNIELALTEQLVGAVPASAIQYGSFTGAEVAANGDVQLGSQPLQATNTELKRIGKLYGPLKLTLDNLKLELQQTRPNQTTIENYEKLIEQKRAGIRTELQSLLDDYYLPEAKILVTSDPSAAKAEIDKLRISTVIGGGFAVLNSTGHGSAEIEGTTYTALKFRLFELVDRSLPDPYPTGRSRISLVVGGLLSNEFRYRGQQLESFGSFFPVIGLGYDINPNFGITIGAVFFKQPSLNPLASNRDSEKAALWLSLDFDADLLNKLKEVTSDGP
ncbi:MAG: hypothetical protein OEV49_15000 [candidate division Zixibacteria bacterium]|nr:hypothetical protein [candidate division Zixibacteria bacterium]MDH3936481.1 hypothetical protein [candidate division Zixibacteria bacterium]MDH4033697.1 hypothetical protein [candidate division Zixibacteria bacterium]